MRMRFILAASLMAVPAAAKAPAMHVEGWARAGIGSSAAYLDIHNGSSTADRLLSVSTSAAKSASVHATTNSNGVSRMRAAGALDLKPDGRLQMKPGGLHVMLMGLKAPLRPGTRLPLTLRFAKAGAVKVDVPVLAPGANPTSERHHGH